MSSRSVSSEIEQTVTGPNFRRLMFDLVRCPQAELKVGRGLIPAETNPVKLGGI